MLVGVVFGAVGAVVEKGGPKGHLGAGLEFDGQGVADVAGQRFPAALVAGQGLKVRIAGVTGFGDPEGLLFCAVAGQDAQIGLDPLLYSGHVEKVGMKVEYVEAFQGRVVRVVEQLFQIARLTTQGCRTPGQPAEHYSRLRVAGTQAAGEVGQHSGILVGAAAVAVAVVKAGSHIRLVPELPVSYPAAVALADRGREATECLVAVQIAAYPGGGRRVGVIICRLRFGRSPAGSKDDHRQGPEAATPGCVDYPVELGKIVPAGARLGQRPDETNPYPACSEVARGVEDRLGALVGDARIHVNDYYPQP